ncbi:hypothetical protein OIV83_000074 [Microbotryomycetes sp. JL201]|nr:hypothetical protein OIV83_000074 [Microbotryomycetes sp. JL201]
MAGQGVSIADKLTDRLPPNHPHPPNVDPVVLAHGIKSSNGLDFVSSARWSTVVEPSFVTGLDQLLGDDSLLRKGDVVELQGVTGSGKSTLLLFLAATAILPKRANGVRVGGREQTVVWLDCAGDVDVLQLAKLCTAHLKSMLPRLPPPDVEKLTLASLRRFVVLRPQSTQQLATIVRDLPSWFMQQSHMPEIRYVMIDGMSRFAWLDQWKTEQLKTSAKYASSEPTADAPQAPKDDMTPAAALRLLISSIARLKKTIAPIVFITQWVFVPSKVTHFSPQDRLPFYAHHLGTPWPSISKPSRPYSVPPRSTSNRFMSGNTNTIVVPDDDPLAPPGPSPGSADQPTFDFSYHITCHPPPPPNVPPEQDKTTLRQAWSSQMSEQKRLIETQQTPPKTGFRCVLRRKGGVELGTWEWDHLGDRLVT